MAKIDVYELVTDRVIASLEKGVIPWKKPWTGSDAVPCNLVSKRPYHGINFILLSMSPYSSRYWATFNQIQKLGGKVKKGEKSSMVVYWNFFKTEETQKDGTTKEKTIPFLKYFSVFNLEQTEGIEAPEERALILTENERINLCENVVNSFTDKPEIIESKSNRAFYVPSEDKVSIPLIKQFKDSESYYGTLFHELTHSTGHETRCNRGLDTSFGSDSYAKEELVAELGASFLCAMTGISPKVEDNSIAYIQNWVARFKEDKKMIVSAAGKAQKAVDWIMKTSEVEDEKSA